MPKSKMRDDDSAGFLKTNGIDSSQTLTLPYHIIVDEILPRLPVKSLIRFKSVSKHWNYTISSYSFAKLRLKFSTSCDNFFVINSKASLFCDLDPSFHLLPQKEYSSVNELIGINVFTDASPSLTLVGCCDGLVCFVYQSERSSGLCVWNPVTRECRDVGNPGVVSRAWACGFGYVSSLNDYMIVSSFGRKGDGNRWSGFYLFSLREGKWKGIGGLDEDVGGHVLLNSVWIDGTVCWSHYDLFKSVYYIIGFNSVKEDLKKYPMTFWKTNGYCGMDLCRLKGCLAMRSFKSDNTYDFWVLKKQDDWSSWEKLFTVNLGNISFIGLFDHGKCLLRRYDQFRLVDLCKKALEHVQGDFVCEGLDISYYGMVKISSYTQSLVSPSRTTKADGEETKDYEV